MTKNIVYSINLWWSFWFKSHCNFHKSL